jgi:WD40 repeat protein
MRESGPRNPSGRSTGTQLSDLAVCRRAVFLPALLLAVLGAIGVAGCTTYAETTEAYRIVDNAHSGGNALTIDPDGQLGASGGWSGRVRLWQLPEGSPLGGWRTGHGDLYGLLFLQGRQLLSAGYDGYVRVWQLDGTLNLSFKAGEAITSFRASPDRSHILLGHDDGVVSLWSVDGEQQGAWRLSSRRITAVAADDGLTRLAAADSAGNVWRWKPGQVAVKVESPPTYPRSLLFGPDGKTLLGSGWFNLFAWHDEGIELTVLPTDHHGIINHLALSPDGSYLASISRINDSAVLLLDPENGETLGAFGKHDLCGQRVAISPDGRIMMSNADDASVRFYRLPEVRGAHEAVAAEAR